MTTNAALLETAFKRFVELVGPIDDVQHVVAIEPRRPDVYTYIRRLHDEVMSRVFRAEDTLADEFPDILIEFHIVFLEGRPFDYFWSSAPELTYSRHDLKKKEDKRGIKR